jgi:hypothetical protein
LKHKLPLLEICARLGVFGAFCALWLFIVAERRGALSAVRLAVAIARICQAAAKAETLARLEVQ